MSRNVSSQQANRLLAATQLNIIAVRQGESVVLYICCARDEFSHLCKVTANPELRIRLEELFKSLVYGVKIKVVAVTILDKDIKKIQQLFKDEALLDKKFEKHFKRLHTQLQNEEPLEFAMTKEVEKMRDPGMSQPMEVMPVLQSRRPHASAMWETQLPTIQGELETEYVMPNPARINRPNPQSSFIPNMDILFHHLTNRSFLVYSLGLYSIAPSYSISLFIQPALLLFYYRLYKHFTIQSYDVVNSFVYVATVALMSLLVLQIYYFLDAIHSYVFFPLRILSSIFILYYTLSRNITLLSNDVVCCSFVNIASVPLLLFSFGFHLIAYCFAVVLCILSSIILLYNCGNRISINPSYSSKWKMCLAFAGTMLVAVVATEVIERWVIPKLLFLLISTEHALMTSIFFVVFQSISLFRNIGRTHLYGFREWLIFALITEAVKKSFLGVGLYFIYDIYKLTLVLWTCNYLLPRILTGN